ncbi:MAG: GntR family transcriptional regulator [Aeromicrobium erythreum]
MTASGRRTVEQVADALRHDVLTGALPAGRPVREEHLAERFGVSRHTVRSALSRLVAQRLLTSEPYRGVRVTLLDDVQLAELQQLRAAIEAEAVRALPAPAAELPGVREAIDRLAARERDGSPWIAVERAHAGVHQALVDAAGSARLSELYRSLEDELALLLLHTRPAFADRDLAAEHRALLAEVDARGPDAVRDHIDGSTRDLLALRRTDAAPGPC